MSGATLPSGNWTPTLEQIEPYITKGLVTKRVRESHGRSIGIFNYTDKCQYERAWDPVTRVCRGLVLDLATGAVVARPFDKFFNIGETPETQWSTLPWASSVVVTEKYDGALGIVFHDGEKWDVATRGSFDSTHAKQARERLLPSLRLEKLRRDATYLAEIIIKGAITGALSYDYDGLVLLGVRQRGSGELLWPAEVPRVAEEIGALPPEVHPTAGGLEDWLKRLASAPGGREGVVVTFRSGPMVKVKTDEYKRVFRILKGTSGKDIVDAVSRFKEDELLASIPEEARDVFAPAFDECVAARDSFLAEARAHYEELSKNAHKKEYALAVQRRVQGHLVPALYAMRDGKDLTRALRRMLEDKVRIKRFLVESEG